MKFYDCSTAPSPRRVRIFIAEKGIDIPVQEVDLRNKEQLEPAFAAINPWLTVPVLELDDGTMISESVAICRYLEEIHPAPPLLGADAKARAQVAMWDRHIENNGFLAVAEALRNSAPRLAGRALTGPVDYEQIPELAERGKARVGHFFTELDARLATSEFVAGEAFSVADITGLVVTDFAGWLKFEVGPDHPHLQRWHSAVSARPGCQV